MTSCSFGESVVESLRHSRCHICANLHVRMLCFSAVLEISKHIINFLKLQQIFALQQLRHFLVDHVASHAHAAFFFRLVPREVRRIGLRLVVSVNIAIVAPGGTLVVKMNIDLNRRLTEITDECLMSVKVCKRGVHHVRVNQRDGHGAERVLRKFSEHGV